MPTPDPTPPLIAVRDLLRDAQNILTHQQEVKPSPEQAAVLDDLIALLLRVKAIGSDAKWAE